MNWRENRGKRQRPFRGSLKGVRRLLGTLLGLLLVVVLVLSWELSHLVILGDARTRRAAPIQDSVSPASTTKAAQPTHTCHDIFGRHQIERNGACLEHKILKWVACELWWDSETGNGETKIQIPNNLRHDSTNHSYFSPHQGDRISIYPNLIDGSAGGEAISEVLNRPEAEEQLVFRPGSLVVSQPIPPRLIESVDRHMRRFLQSATILEPRTQATAMAEKEPGLSNRKKPEDSNGLSLSTLLEKQSATVTLLVRRGNYANPCMTLLTMYNVYVVLEFYYNYFTPNTTAIPLSLHIDASSPPAFHLNGASGLSSLKIIWLDGHAKGDLDPVWGRLFQTDPVHIKQLPLRWEGQAPSASAYASPALDSTNQDSSEAVPLSNLMVVNTMSAIGDEGMGLYRWDSDTIGNGSLSSSLEQGFGEGFGEAALTRTSSRVLPSSTSSFGCENSTLVSFRNFVLERYGLSRSSQPKPILTLLVRKDYQAHPRSSGQTDRKLANLEEDLAYLKSEYPSHSVRAVSFEGVSFEQQLRTIIGTDILVAVHGAGNIHVLFLPEGASLVEYVPQTFRRRHRFRYLASCLGINYTSKQARISKRIQISPGKEQILVQLRP